jgi:NADH-quinone oxidoreductase subunit M
MYAETVLTALLAWPALAAVLVLLVPARWAKHVALVASLVEFAIAVPLWWTFVPAAGMQYQLDVPWILAWGIHYTVGVDGISLFLVLLTTFLVPLSVLGSYRYITRREPAFYALLLVLTSGMVGVFVSLDLFLFYVMWEVMLIPMYFIIGVWGGENRLYAAIKFFIYTFFGSLLMLVAILALVYVVAQRTGSYSFSYAHLLAHVGGLGPLAFWMFGAFFVAFAIKVPMFPFHTWLPDAHVEAPTAGSVLLAGILLKMGTYGFLRFAWPFFPQVALYPAVQTGIVVLSLIGIVYGGLVAMVQPDFKKLVAYSSVAHLGFVVLGIWALTLQSVQGALLVMINHGISTGALFFLVGMLYERRHSRLIAAFGGIAKVVPLLATALTLVALSSIALPATNGFVGELLVLLGAFRTYPIAATVATTGVIVAAMYLLPALQRVIYNPLDQAENERLVDLSPREIALLAPLLACIVWIGVYPKPILERMEPTARQFIQAMRTADERAAGTAGTAGTARVAESGGAARLRIVTAAR